jgi:hypothetical protein
MKLKSTIFSTLVLACGWANGQTLYYTESGLQESVPLKWVGGTTLTYDDNLAAGYARNTGIEAPKEDSFAVGPYVGMTLFSKEPQTTWDISGQIGAIYYLDEPTSQGVDQFNNQSRLMVNYARRINDRLRFTSNNFANLEVQPDYSYGYASAVTSGEYLFWQTDNALGYRWSDLFGTYTGFKFRNLSYENTSSNDRSTYEIYNQVRYRLSDNSVLTGDYRFAETSGETDYNDYTDHYLLGGLEHRFSPNTVGNFRLGVQFHKSDYRSVDSTSPYTELALNSSPNADLTVRTFIRYGIETNDTGQVLLSNLQRAEFSDRRTLRIGVSSNYSISPKLGVFGGLDYIPTAFSEGAYVPNGLAAPDGDEQLINAYVGVSLKFTDYLTGSATYNFTNSDSDYVGSNYDRNRFTLGLSAEF